jgi:class 3 adenylate cyclase/ABC-type transport system involved in cytochrome c biogenesis ATPase subunit
MTSFSDWLREIGLEHYTQVLVQHEIDFEILAALTDDDLRELGLTLGARRKLLQAAAQLNLGVPDAKAGASATRSSVPSSITGERRQLTVLFCDLVGSTALSERLDPEELRELLQRYRQTCADIVVRYDGHLAQFLGDGVMAYFGWPRAHEDEAERAVRAALEIVHSVKRVQGDEPLRVRLGLATGSVVVGDAGQTGDGQLAVGDTPNLASRLQGLAGPDEVVIASSTRRLIASNFELTDLGEQALKGILQPVRAWKVEALSKSDDRFEATHRALALSPLVGREEELALLLRRWARAREAEGQVVLVGGEPGIGKSRLVRALRQQLAGQPHVVLRYQCSPFHQNSALHPVIEQLEHAAGIAHEDSSEQKLDKLEAVLAGSADEIARAAPLFAAQMSLPLQRYAPMNLSPEEQKERTLEAIAGQVEVLARQQPVLMLYEDLHWTDATSQEALDLLVPRLQTLPVLLVATHRPEYRPRWQEQAHVSALGLNRLSRHEAAALVQGVTGGKALPPELLEQITAKTDGVPLFVEELTKTVLESGMVVERGDAFERSSSLPALALPSTLRDSLIARLDRLGAVKDVAQIGACIGREFDHELLLRLTPLRDRELEQGLQQLIDAGLILRKGAPAQVTYIFKHALVQDAAYDSLLKSRRHQIHARIAEVLEREFPDRVSNAPEILAHHFTEAGMGEPAVPHWISAGRRALSRTAVAEAIGHLNTALRVNALTGASAARDENELDIRVLLWTAYQAMAGWVASEVMESLGRTRELAVRLDATDRLIPIFFHIRNHYAMRGEFRQALSTLDEMRALGEAGGESSALLLATWLESEIRCWLGDFPGAHRCGGEALAIYDADAHSRLVHTYNHDPRCGTMVWAGLWLWALGHPDQARRVDEENVTLARDVGHAWNLAWVLLAGVYPQLLEGELDPVQRRLAEAHAIATEHGLSFLIELTRWWRGIALIRNGEHEEGYLEASAGESFWRSSCGGVISIPWSMAHRAEALAGMHRLDDAQALLEETLQLSGRTGHVMWDAETHRIAGNVALAGATPDDCRAEASFLRSIEVARAQQARGFELRTAVDLARLWQTQGRNEEACNLLAPLSDWFTEGFDTPDLKQARSLLAELR